MAGITFDAGAPAYTLGGNGITLTGNLTNSSANDQVINLPITLPGTGPIQVDTGSKWVTLGGSVSGSGGGLTKIGSGTLQLGAISYTGDTTIGIGTLVLTQVGLSRSSTVTIGSTAGASAVLNLSHGRFPRNGHAGCSKWPLSSDLHDSCGWQDHCHIQFRRQRHVDRPGWC